MARPRTALARIVGREFAAQSLELDHSARAGAHLRLDRHAVGGARDTRTCSSGSSTAARCATACS